MVPWCSLRQSAHGIASYGLGRLRRPERTAVFVWAADTTSILVYMQTLAGHCTFRRAATARARDWSRAKVMSRSLLIFRNVGALRTAIRSWVHVGDLRL